MTDKLSLFDRIHSKRRFKRVIILSMMFLIFLSGVISVNAMGRDCIIIDSDSTTIVKMINPDLESILNKADIQLGPNDVAIFNDKEATVTIKRGFNVTVNCDNHSSTAIFHDGNVGYALSEMGVTLGQYDKTSPDINTALSPDLTITVNRYCQIAIKDSSTVKTHIVPVGTVKDCLQYLNITLGADDTMNLKETDIVAEGTTIEINRIGYHESVVKEKIPYSTIKMESDDLPLGTSQVDTQGVDGEQVITTLETYVNGTLTDTQVISKVVTIQPVNEIILVGTKETAAKKNTSSASQSSTQSNNSNSSANVYGNVLIDHNGNEVSYQSMLTGSATAYTSEPGAITSTGRVAQFGYVAVNPSIIPYGSKLYICSPDGSFVYGYAIAADTGGALMDGSALVDCYYPSMQECVNFGRRQMCIYILG
ncbi:MAG: G5 domain-containing protein [Clostridia bacterium]|nr:G5 domain-containing protein [Clostridia bacterium]